MNVSVECRNPGCDEVFHIAEKTYHNLDCKSRIIECPQSNCQFQGQIPQLIQHIINTKDHFMAQPDKEGKIEKIYRRDKDEEPFTDVEFVIQEDELFAFNLECMGEGGGFFYVNHFGKISDSGKFRYTLMVQTPDGAAANALPKLIYTGKVDHDSTEEADDVRENYLCLDNGLWQVAGSDSEYLKLTLEIVKID